MSTEDDQDVEPGFEAQVRAELQNQLDRHVGRAAPYFLERCASGNVGGRRRLSWVGVVVAAAACGAAFVAWQQTRPPVAGPGDNKAVVLATPKFTPGATRDGTALIEPKVAEPEVRNASDGAEAHPAPSSVRSDVRQPLLLGQAFSTRTRDEGTLLVGRTPVRKVRRQWLERVEWFDPENGARVQRIVPHEEVLFVPLPIN